ncbi:MAG: helix-turn-helix domain-containing protein [Candidatus Omnitrophica bacterium]|nr:helix-turn-helix domain-containing protein [Candidatus Omnitrophota bacterium]
MQPEYLTTTQASKILHVSRFSVLHWIKQGKIKAVSTLGGHQRIPKESIVSLLSKKSFKNRIKNNIKPQVKIIPCWEAKESLGSNKHNCNDCLVYKEKINRCFLSLREYAGLKVECGIDCPKCGYLKVYFPKEYHEIQNAKQDTIIKTDSHILKDESADLGGKLKKGLFISGKYFASLKNRIAKVPLNKFLL